MLCLLVLTWLDKTAKSGTNSICGQLKRDFLIRYLNICVHLLKVFKIFDVDFDFLLFKCLKTDALLKELSSKLEFSLICLKIH